MHGTRIKIKIYKLTSHTRVEDELNLANKIFCHFLLKTYKNTQRYYKA